MDQQISAEEAQRALQEIALSRERMKEVIRAHHGHAYLWLWGVITVFDCIGTHVFGGRVMQTPSLIAMAVGVVGSIAISFWRSLRIRVQVDRRFLAVAVMIIVMHLAVIPAIMGWPHDVQAMYAYTMLFWAEIYIVAGVWFNNFLVWCGIVCILFLLVGLLVFPQIFWLWCGLTVGGTLIGSGFVLRYGPR